MAIIKINVQHIYGFTMIKKLHEKFAMYLTYSICIYQIIYYDLFSIYLFIQESMYKFTKNYMKILQCI